MTERERRTLVSIIITLFRDCNLISHVSTEGFTTGLMVPWGTNTISAKVSFQPKN